MFWDGVGSREYLQERAGGRAYGGMIPWFRPSPYSSPGERMGQRLVVKSKGAGSIDGNRTPRDATGTGPWEDVECRGWKPLEGTPNLKGPMGTADASWEAHDSHHSSGNRALTGNRERQAGKAQGRRYMVHGCAVEDRALGSWHMEHATWHTGCIVGDAAAEHGTRTRGYAVEAASWGQETGTRPGGAAGTQQRDRTHGHDRGTRHRDRTHGQDRGTGHTDTTRTSPARTEPPPRGRGRDGTRPLC